MRSYLAGNHEFTVEENGLDPSLVEHEVPFKFLTVSLIYLMHEDNLWHFLNTDESVFIGMEQLF